MIPRYSRQEMTLLWTDVARLRRWRDVELAALEGISPSAVSQRVRADGLGAVLAAHELLRGMP